MYSWLTLRFDIRRFEFLKSHLAFLGIELYAPIILVPRKRPDRPGLRNVEEHFFPGYVFIRVDTEFGHPMAVTELNGVHGFITFSGAPMAIRQDDIDQIKAAVRKWNNAALGKGHVIIGGHKPDPSFRIAVDETSNQAFHMIVQQPDPEARIASFNSFQKQMHRARANPNGGELKPRRPNKLVIGF